MLVNLNPIALEADVAYFNARLELVGSPETYYQQAQVRVYGVLAKTLEETLKCLKGREEQSRSTNEQVG